MHLAELEQRFQEIRNGIDDVRLYFELKQRKLIRSSMQLASYKTVIALHKVGLPINSATYVWIHKSTLVSAVSVLHAMGDRHLLILTRNPDENVKNQRKGKPLSWILSPMFKEIIEKCC